VTGSLFNYDPQTVGPQYLEDLATGYWFSYVLFAAVEADIFGRLDGGGKDAHQIAEACGLEAAAIGRLLDALCALGLLARDGATYFNARIASDYLVPGKPGYQGEAILWRKELIPHWSTLRECLKAGRRVMAPGEEGADAQSRRIGRYLEAMDCAARVKAGEMKEIFSGLSLKGEMLDVGAGSGAVSLALLEAHPALSAVLVDIPEVIGHTREFVARAGKGGRVELKPANILEPWHFKKRRFSLVMLSNIVHAYSEEELPHILGQAASVLAKDGLLVIHDFFFDHYPEKAALFDINMLINTYNGRVFAAGSVQEELKKLKLHATCLTPLAGDTALIVASRADAALDALTIDKRARLVSRIKALGFKRVAPVPIEGITVADWVQTRCEFGCDRYGSPGCPPNSPTPDETRRILKGYSFALLLEGEPPTGDFQHLVLAAEREAFVAGLHKTLAFWAGPCSQCPACVTDGRCRNRKECRPSMEGSGIDVFETARRAGIPLATLTDRDGYVKYFGLLLVE
jgi:predicted metal-binding protein/predicted O-methyltransferase YrrM